MQNTFFQPRCIFIRSFFHKPHVNPPASPGNDAEPLYAVIQVGIGCYGIGPTRQRAIAAARNWLAAEPDVHSLTEFSRTLDQGSLCIARCTERYAQKIREKGGVGWVPFRISAEGVFDYEPPDDFEVSPGEIENDIERNSGK